MNARNWGSVAKCFGLEAALCSLSTIILTLLIADMQGVVVKFIDNVECSDQRGKEKLHWNEE